MNMVDKEIAWHALPQWMKAFGRERFIYKYNHTHDEKGRFSTSDGTSNDKDPIHQKKQNFVNRYLSATERAAKQLNLPAVNILGLAALESGWGIDSRFAVQGNSFFSMHYPAPYAAGYITVDSSGVKVATYSSYEDALHSFSSRFGDIVSGVSDPQEFATVLQREGKFGIKNGVYDPSYVPKLAGTIRGLSSFIERARTQKP